MVKNKVLSAVASISLALFFICWLTACSPQSEMSVEPIQQAAVVVTDTPFNPKRHDWPHSTSDIAPDARVNFGRLQNGLRYAILPAEDDRGVVSIQMNVPVGFKHEPEGQYGIAHLLEHMAFRGARGENGGSIIHDLQAKGVGFGFDLNGATQYENTYYTLSLPDASDDKLDLAFKSFNALVQDLDLSDASLEAEKKVVLAELKLRDSDEARARQNAAQFRYPDHIRKKVPGVGTPESLAAITLEDVEKFYAQHYRPENILLIITGDVELKDTEKSLSNLFSDWVVEQKIERPNSRVETTNIEAFPTVYHHREEGLKIQINALENTPSTKLNDTISFRQKRLAETLVRSIIKTRMRPLIEAEKDVSWIHVYNSRADEYDIREVAIGAKNHKRAMEIFELERLRILKYGFTPEEIIYALDTERDLFKRLIERSGKINSYAEATRLRNTFTSGQVYMSPQQEFAQFEEFSQALTAKDYHDVAKKMWGEFNPRYWTQSDISMKSKLAGVKAVREAVAKAKLTPPGTIEQSDFELPALGEKGEVVSRDVITSKKIRTVLYANGARLNHKRTTTNDDTVQIAVTLKTNFSDIAEDYGFISERLTILSRADILGADKSEMDRKFLGKKANFSVSLNEKNIVISATTRRRDIAANLRVIAAFLTHIDINSTHHKKAFSRFRSRLETATKNSPVLAGSFQIPLAYSDDESPFMSHGAGSYGRYSSIGLLIRKAILTSPIEVGIIGDFASDDLESIFASTLGAIPARENLPEQEDIGDIEISMLDPGVTSLTYSGADKQMALFYCWPGNQDASLKNDATLWLTSELFKNRMYESFREDLGVTYSPGVVNYTNRAFPSLKYTCFSIQFDPKDESLVHENFNKSLERASSEPFTKTEFNRAKEPIMSLLERYWSTDAAMAIPVSVSYSNPKLLQDHTNTPKRLKTLKLKDINRYFGKNFDKLNLHIFRVQHVELEKTLNKKTLEVKARNGDVEGQFKLGLLFHKEHGVENTEEAFFWFEKAASQGHKGASYYLGRLYALEKKNPLKAAEHLIISENEEEGAFLLADMYFKNPDLFPDITDEQIMELYILSSRNGYFYAQQALAQRYKDGSITPRNEFEALKWAMISRLIESNSLASTETSFIQRFRGDLSDAEQARAEKEARDWVSDFVVEIPG